MGAMFSGMARVLAQAIPAAIAASRAAAAAARSAALSASRAGQRAAQAARTSGKTKSGKVISGAGEAASIGLVVGGIFMADSTGLGSEILGATAETIDMTLDVATKLTELTGEVLKDSPEFINFMRMLIYMAVDLITLIINGIKSSQFIFDWLVILIPSAIVIWIVSKLTQIL